MVLILKLLKLQEIRQQKAYLLPYSQKQKDENKSYSTISEPASITDLEGNDVKINWDKSLEVSGNLTLNVPKKAIMVFTYKDDNLYSEGPRTIKLFKFKFISKVESKNILQRMLEQYQNLMT